MRSLIAFKEDIASNAQRLLYEIRVSVVRQRYFFGREARAV